MARMFVAGFFQDGVPLATSLGAYYTAYVKTASGNTGLDPGWSTQTSPLLCLKASIATIRNATVATALSLPTTTDFTYAMIVANLAALEALLGTTGAHDTIVAAYTNADTVITGTITNHVLAIEAGKSTMDRLRGRAIESLYLIQNILGAYNKVTNTWAGGWCAQLRAESGAPALNVVGSTWRQKAIPAGTVSGWGGTEAPRGALMHTITINAGKITKYQCIVPTTWNGSPCVGVGHRVPEPRCHRSLLHRCSVRRRREGGDRSERWRYSGCLQRQRWRRSSAYCPVIRSVHRLRDPLVTGR